MFNIFINTFSKVDENYIKSTRIEIQISNRIYNAK